MKKIILAGNAITADILNNYLSKDPRYQVVCSTVDDDYVEKNIIKELDTIPLSHLKSSYAPNEYSVVMAMGYNDINRSRGQMFHRLKTMGYHIETFIHPDAKVYTHLPIGEGCVILPSAVIEPGVSIGANSMIWANVTLAHHSNIKENCWIASGAVVSGQVTVERNTFIGVNATIVNDIKVAEYSLIGAGALITKNTQTSTVHLARSAEQLRYSAEDYVKFFGI